MNKLSLKISFIIMALTLIQWTNVNAQVTTFTVAEGWQTPLTLVNNGTTGSWGQALKIDTKHNHVYAIKCVKNNETSSYFSLGAYGMSMSVGASITSNAWALKLNNNTSTHSTALGTDDNGIFSITKTSNDYSTHSKPFAIFSNGNVGINTIVDKGYKLSVNGTMGVNGTITATKLEIRNSSIVWADYVFKKDYNLMPLSELEQYVKQNSHLPNVPSAQDVEENGIEVGEMNKILLEKVEELTLYVIQLKKEIDQIKEKQ